MNTAIVTKKTAARTFSRNTRFIVGVILAVTVVIFVSAFALAPKWSSNVITDTSVETSAAPDQHDRHTRPAQAAPAANALSEQRKQEWGASRSEKSAACQSILNKVEQARCLGVR